MACAPAARAGSIAVFADGFEPPCNGTQNDAPGCIRMVFGGPLDADDITIPTRATWARIDLYLLLDRSSSMLPELSNLASNGSAAIDARQCAPAGSGPEGQCVPSLWSGAGTFAFSDSGAATFAHALDVGNATDLSTLPTGAAPGANGLEATRLALHSVITGQGGALCSIAALDPRADCAASPAGATGFGYGCFRTDAVPVIVLVSDEQTSVNFTCPDWTSVVLPALLGRNARLMSILGDGASMATRTEFESFALSTRTVDVTSGGEPLVFQSAGGNATSALSSGLQRFQLGAPLDVEAIFLDDPDDTLDTSIFVDHIETYQDGTAECSDGLTAIDSGGHPSPDRFVNLRGGTPICFRLVLRENLTVPPGNTATTYSATLRILGEDRMPIEELRLNFVVPAA